MVIDAARQYGLIRGGPTPNRERCDDILARGKARGVTPSKDAVERFTSELERQEL